VSDHLATRQVRR